MQFTFVTVFSLLAAAVIAAPTTGAPATTTVQLSNDQSGRNAAAVIPLDGVPRLVDSLFRNSAVDNNGLITATSSQLTQVINGVACVFAFNGAVIGTLNDQHTFVDLDGNPNAAIQVVLNGVTLQCEI